MRAQWARLRAAGLELDEVEHVPGAVDYFDFSDPDGNQLSRCTELEQPPG